MNRAFTFLFGFNREAENLNGRLAMLAFILVIVIELFTGEPIIHIF